MGCMNPGTCVVAEYGRSVPPDLTQLGYNVLGSSFLGITGGIIVYMGGGVAPTPKVGSGKEAASWI